ncbi:MAG: hypothetical protein ACE5GI_00860 [Candidatus Aminicenantales bacterium]
MRVKQHFQRLSIFSLVIILVLAVIAVGFSRQEKTKMQNQGKMGHMDKMMMSKRMSSQCMGMMNMGNMMMRMQAMSHQMKNMMENMQSMMANQEMMKDEVVKKHMEQMQEHMKKMVENMQGAIDNMQKMNNRLEELESQKKKE